MDGVHLASPLSSSLPLAFQISTFRIWRLVLCVRSFVIDLARSCLGIDVSAFRADLFAHFSSRRQAWASLVVPLFVPPLFSLVSVPAPQSCFLVLCLVVVGDPSTSLMPLLGYVCVCVCMCTDVHVCMCACVDVDVLDYMCVCVIVTIGWELFFFLIKTRLLATWSPMVCLISRKEGVCRKMEGV